MRANNVLLLGVLVLLLAIDASCKVPKASKSKSMSIGSKGLTVKSYKNGKSTSYTYSRTTPRDLNYGSRYYMQYSTVTSTNTFGYSFYRSGSYYYSGYGYRMYYPPSYYAPVYVGTTYYYFPPMFFYYYRTDPNNWNGNRPRYVCRNDNAFWPLENQTSEFVDGRLPALDLSQFDLDLPDPTPSPLSSMLGSSTGSSFNATSALSGEVTELNSLTLNTDPFAEIDFYNEDESLTTRGWTPKLSTTKQWTSAWLPSSEKKPILVYNYFVCPDGKDPSETFCCGPSNAQYCCDEEEFQGERSAWTWVIVGVAGFLLLVVVALMVSVSRKLRRNCHHQRMLTRQLRIVQVNGETVTMTTHTADFVPAPTYDPLGSQQQQNATAGPTSYPTSYQPVVHSEPTDQSPPYPSASASVPTYPAPTAPYPSTFAPYPTGPSGVPYPSLTSPAPYVPANAYTTGPSGGV